MRVFFAIFSLVVMAGLVPAFAETVQDRRTWINLTVRGPLGSSRWRWYFDIQERNRSDSGEADQFVARPAIGYALSDKSSLWAGYAYTANFTESGRQESDESYFVRCD
jgi:hypothetical protein